MTAQTVGSPNTPSQQEAIAPTLVSIPAQTVVQYESLPDFGVDVVKRRQIGSHVVRGVCTIEDNEFPMSDGSRYRAQIFHPKKPRYDIPVTYTTPWCTDLPGFNTEIGKQLASEGMTAVAVSPEQPSFIRACRNLGKVSFGHDAVAHHAILRAIEEDGLYQPRKVMIFGYSRGSMVGKAIAAYSPQMGVEVAFEEDIDPCVMEPDSVLQLKPTQIKAELAEAGNHLLHLSYRELRHLHKTVRLHPSAVLQQVGTGKAIFDGQAGQFVDRLPADIVSHVTLYNSNPFNRGWKQRLSEYPNIVINDAEGYHLSYIDKAARQATMSRFVLVQEMLEAHQPNNAIASELRTRALKRAG